MTIKQQEDEIQTVFIDSLEDFIRELKEFEENIKGDCPGTDQDKKVAEEPAPNYNQESEKNPIKSPLKFLLWYRGTPDFNFNLVPRLYRNVEKHLKERNLDLKEDFWPLLKEDEEYYLKNFKIRNYHLLQRLPENPLTWMTIMQHYEVPTRLLDWSESATASFFFALNDEFSQKREYEGCAPCVWCLKPRTLNEYTKEHYQLKIDTRSLPDMFSIKEFSMPHLENGKENDDNLSKYYFHTQSKTLNKGCYPLAINAPYNNDRIRAQSGAFTLFPLDTPKNFEKLEDLGMENLPEAGKFLCLFILRKPAEISYELKAIGVKRSQFYPEMPSISYDIEQELYKSF